MMLYGWEPQTGLNIVAHQVAVQGASLNVRHWRKADISPFTDVADRRPPPSRSPKLA